MCFIQIYNKTRRILKMNILDFLASDNYIALNRDLVRLFGLQEAVLFSELCSEYRYWDNNNGLDDGYF